MQTRGLTEILYIISRLKKTPEQEKHYQQIKQNLSLQDWESLLKAIASYPTTQSKGALFFKDHYSLSIKELYDFIANANRDILLNKLLREINEYSHGRSNLTKIKQILDAGAVLSINQFAGPPINTNALRMALDMKDKGLIELLLANGVTAEESQINPNQVLNAAAETPLHIAAELGVQDLAVELVSNNADVNAVRNDGATPLHLAMSAGHDPIASLLILRKASILKSWQAKDPELYTPFFIALEKKNIALADLMIESGYKVTQFDLIHARHLGKDFESLYKKMKQPFRQEKETIIETSKKINPSITHPQSPIDYIIAQVYTTDPQLLALLREKLEHIYDTDPILRPLIEAMALAAQGNRLVNEFKDKPLKWVITQDQDVEKLTGTKGGLGEFKNKSTVFVAGGNPELLVASFLHESKHFADSDIYPDKNPYTQSQKHHFLQVKEQLEQHARKALDSDSGLDKDDRFIYTSILGIFSYHPSKQDLEVLVKVPEILGYLGIKKGLVWLEQHEPALLAFYKLRFNRACENHNQLILDQIKTSTGILPITPGLANSRTITPGLFATTSTDNKTNESESEAKPTSTINGPRRET